MENGDSDSDNTDNEGFSSDDETDQINKEQGRSKRDIEWCGVEDEAAAAAVAAPKITWPPPNPSSDWRQLRPVRPGNPYYGPKMQLYSKTGHFLGVYPEGVVRGTLDDNDLHTFLEVIAAGHPGHVRIKGLLTNLYVALDPKGRPYADADQNETATIFIEAFQGLYNSYLSTKYAHLGWYLGIKKNGKGKRGSKTAYGQKAIRFLPRRNRFQ